MEEIKINVSLKVWISIILFCVLAIADAEIAKDRKQRSKAALQGYPYEVYVSGLSMKPQEICDLLNSRINQIQK